MPMSKKLVVDCRIAAEAENALTTLGYELIKIPENIGFDKPICAHPDMFCAKIKNRWFVDSSLAHLFGFLDGGVTEINRPIFNKIEYPFDVGFNCAVVGNNVICNVKYTFSEIVDYINEHNMNIINVKQGYSKCSTCVVNDNSIITEDQSIAKAAGENGIDVLLIKKGYIRLSGYNYGFIGGAGGLIENNMLAFNGNVELHPDSHLIYNFCKDRNVEIVSLCNAELYDIGTIFKI